MGKWFVQPTESPPAPMSSAKKPSETGTAGIIGAENGPSTPNSNGYNGVSANLSFSFAFFVHGESSVCASVDVRQHPPVRRLSRWHVQQAQASSSGLKVILAPFGLAGTLTGQTYKSPEVGARLLEDWSHFYPLDKSNALTESSVVEVLVGGCKMRYPACYVLVTDMDEEANAPTMNGGNAGQTPAMTTEERIGNGGEKRRVESPVSSLRTPPVSPVKISSRVPQPGPYTVRGKGFLY